MIDTYIPFVKVRLIQSLQLNGKSNLFTSIWSRNFKHLSWRMINANFNAEYANLKILQQHQQTNMDVEYYRYWTFWALTKFTSYCWFILCSSQSPLSFNFTLGHRFRLFCESNDRSFNQLSVVCCLQGLIRRVSFVASLTFDTQPLAKRAEKVVIIERWIIFIFLHSIFY